MNALTPAEFEFLKTQAEVLACSRFAQNLSPADIVYAHLSIGRARGWSIAQTLQNIHVMIGDILLFAIRNLPETVSPFKRNSKANQCLFLFKTNSPSKISQIPPS